jgi:hypothetical protein
VRQSVWVVVCALAAVGAGCVGDGAAMTTAPITATVTLPPLVESHGLGYGFRLGAADQTAGLFVWFTDLRTAAEGNIPKVSVLPDSRWEVEVRIGSDLFADPYSQPVPWVDEVWPVVAGKITILERSDPDGACGYAKALLEDFEAIATDGTRVPLGDFDVENRSRGCFAR